MRRSVPPAAVPTIVPAGATWPKPSPLMMCDRLITLAQDADRAGLAVTAGQLIHLAHAVLEEGRPQRRRAANAN